jgi:predicted RNase H-like nuclease (RuvC/YqgF family)
VVAGILRDRRVMDEEAINRARLRSQLWRENRHLFNRNEGVGELRRLSEEELEERDEAVAMQMEGLAPSLNYATRIASYRAELMRREVVLQRERMEELTANLVRQREQMETLNDNLNRLVRIVAFATVVGVLVRRVRP